MKKASLISLLSLLCLTGCNSGNNEQPEEKHEEKKYVDVFLFSGQSNMSGYGEHQEAIPVGEGHGFEYLAVSGNDETGYLKKAAEPFGKDENNTYIPDGKNKQGGMVTAFMESYYQTTSTPVIGVSASKAGTSLNYWKVGTTAHEEAKRRLKDCITYVTAKTDYTIRHINLLWCQGCGDASEYCEGTFSDYFEVLHEMVNDFKTIDTTHKLEKCFVVLPSEYTGGEIKETKKKLAADYVTYCELHPEDFYLATTKTRNVPSSLRQDPHFHQGVYNVVGYDAGARVGARVYRKKVAEYSEFIPGEEVTLAEKFGINLTYKA